MCGKIGGKSTKDMLFSSQSLMTRCEMTGEIIADHDYSSCFLMRIGQDDHIEPVLETSSFGTMVPDTVPGNIKEDFVVFLILLGYFVPLLTNISSFLGHQIGWFCLSLLGYQVELP